MKFRSGIFYIALLVLYSCGSSLTLVQEDPQTIPFLQALDSLGIAYEILEDGPPMELTLYIQQFIDHNDTVKGSFRQRAHMTLKNLNSPNVLSLSGYSIGPKSPQTELAELLNANQIFLEHRYFGKSVPSDNIEPKLLNIYQSVEDIHEVREQLGHILKGAWASTGISKGGQTVMYHKAFYRDDVQASVVYVAPLNMEEEDPRIQEFLKNVGSSECRATLRALQKDVLMNYDLSLAYFKDMAEFKAMHPEGAWEEFFELSILEYEFAFWQWNSDCAKIPSSGSDLKAKVDHLFQVGSPDFFSQETRKDLFPFFFQAYSEMGMYGYSVSGLESLTRFFKQNVSNKTTFIPDSYDLDFSSRTHKEVKSRLDSLGNHMMYIQGEFDPWSSTRYIPTEETDSRLFIVEKGNHKSRIKDLPPSDQEAIRDSLMRWMKY